MHCSSFLWAHASGSVVCVYAELRIFCALWPCWLHRPQPRRSAKKRQKCAQKCANLCKKSFCAKPFLVTPFCHCSPYRVSRFTEDLFVCICFFYKTRTTCKILFFCYPARPWLQETGRICYELLMIKHVFRLHLHLQRQSTFSGKQSLSV